MLPCLAALKAEGVRLIDEAPRTGAHNTRIAFMHPKASGLEDPLDDPHIDAHGRRTHRARLRRRGMLRLPLVDSRPRLRPRLGGRVDPPQLQLLLMVLVLVMQQVT